jgi:hypothetical protein
LTLRQRQPRTAEADKGRDREREQHSDEKPHVRSARMARCQDRWD